MNQQEFKNMVQQEVKRVISKGGAKTRFDENASRFDSMPILMIDINEGDEASLVLDRDEKAPMPRLIANSIDGRYRIFIFYDREDVYKARRILKRSGLSPY